MTSSPEHPRDDRTDGLPAAFAALGEADLVALNDMLGKVERALVALRDPEACVSLSVADDGFSAVIVTSTSRGNA